MAIEKVINIVANAKQATSEIKKLYNDLLETELAQKELNDSAEQMGDAYKKSSKESVASVDKQSKAMKALNAVSGGVKKGFQAIGTVFKGLGIGLVVALVAKLTQVLSENQKVVDFVSTVSTTLSIVINDLINKFSDIFSKISEATGGFDALGKVVGGVVKIAFNQLKSTVLSLQAGFTALKLAYEKVFGDDEGVKKAQKDLTDIGKKIAEVQKDNITQGKKIINNIGEAVNEVVTGVSILTTEGTKAISEIDLKSSYAQAQAINRNKKNFELLALQQARLQLSFQNQAELQRQIRDDTNKSLTERIKANNELSKILDKQFQAESATIKARISGLQQEQSLLGFTQERYNEIYQLQTDLIDVEERLNGQRSEQLTNTNGLLQEQKDLIQSQVDTQNELAISKKEFDAEQEENELLKLEKLKEKILLEEEIALAELERKRELYELDTQNRADAENDFLLKKQEIDQALIENAKATNAQIIAQEKIVADAKKEIQDSTINTISEGVNLLSQLAGKSKELQKAAIIAESAVGLGKMIIANNTANVAALATPQAIATAGASAIPVIALNNISTGIGVASTVASTAKALSALGGGGSAPSAGSTPSAGGSAPSAPSFNLVQGTGSNQIAESLATERRPLQAYVVASNITSAQELERNTISEATV